LTMNKKLFFLLFFLLLKNEPNGTLFFTSFKYFKTNYKFFSYIKA